MNEWMNVKLGEILTLNYGKGLPETQRCNGAIPVYSSAGITGRHNSSLVDQPGIIVGRKGTVGSVYYSDIPFYPIDTTYYLTKDDTNEDLMFIYYLLNHLPLNEMNTDSAVPGLNRNNAYNLLINLPPLLVQRRIAAILSSLDDKIENNRKICEKLEEIAQAIFKRWFVDFEFPTEDGLPYKSSGGEMEYCEELGKEIPKGWHVGVLQDLGTIVGGSTPSKSNDAYYQGGDIPWITPKDLSGYNYIFIDHGETFITKEGYQNSSAKLLRKGSILFSSRAPIGYIAIASNKVCTNQGFKSIEPDKGYGTEYLYELLKYITPQIINAAGGSTFKEISGSGMKIIPVMVPKKAIVEKYCFGMAGLFNAILNMETESATLQQIRDALLPKLMSGEIAVEEREVG